MTGNFLRTFTLATLTLLFALACAPARAEEGDELSRSLGLSGDEPAALSRLPRPASHIAENVTVVTAEEIARLNAHTVADVLHTVPGMQMELLQTPGGVVLYDLLGSSNRHILVQIDGVPQNFVSAENLAHLGSIPAQMVERIEIVKGAASAAWGSALGGVINVITKSPVTDRGAAGVASASLGKESTSDLRGEISGSADRFGYYLTGGTLRSNGLIPGNDVDFHHGFGKLSYDLPGGGRATLGLDARYLDAGLSESVLYNFFETGAIRYSNAYLALQLPLAQRLSLELNAHGGVRDTVNRRGFLSTGSLFYNAQVRESSQGYAAVVNWGDAERALKAGVEFERIEVRQRELVQRRPGSAADLTLTRYTSYLNGTYTMGRLSLLPGVRLDRLNLLEDPVSYTMGVTLRLGESTLLRGYAARGYSMPLISNYGSPTGEMQRELQQVRTLQWGAESTALPYLWLKAMLFHNKIWDIQEFDYEALLMRTQKQRRHGVDLELRSSSWYGLSLSAGYTFTESRRSGADQRLGRSEGGPRHAVKGALNYADAELGLTCVLTANYADWDVDTPGSKPEGTLWDLHLTQKLMPARENSPELFLSLRNIFDGEIYQYDFRPAAPRWLEIGGRYRF